MSWDESCEKAFNILKASLVFALVLGYPTRDDNFILETNASGSGVGAVFSQIQQRREAVVAFAKHTEKVLCNHARAISGCYVCEAIQTLSSMSPFYRAH